MIDTIGLDFPNFKIAKEVYENWEIEDHHRYKKFWVREYVFNGYLPNASSIRFSYYPYLNNGLLKIVFSLPNVIYGNNVDMIHNIKEAVNLANSLMPEIPEAPRVHLWQGQLFRLDLCYNFQVGDLVLWYIKALRFLEYPYRKTEPYTSEGVQYRNDRVILKFYDKERERRVKKDPEMAKKAVGTLRMELELKKEHLKKIGEGKKRITLRDINEEMVYDILENELRELNLLGNSIGTFDSTLKKLRNIYGTWEAFSQAGLLAAKVQYPSIELLAQDAKLHPNSIGRHIQKKFAANGIPPTLTEYVEPLPPLVIERRSKNKNRNMSKSRGDTYER